MIRGTSGLPSWLSLRALTRQASERRITPSDRIFRWFALSVEPVEVMSTMISAEPSRFTSKLATNLVLKSAQMIDTRDANGVMPSDHKPMLVVYDVK